MSDEHESEIPDSDRYAREEDAPWKMMQKNTFTRWCNMQLRMHFSHTSMAQGTGTGTGTTVTLGASGAALASTSSPGTPSSTPSANVPQITDLFTDFSDGLLLLSLVEGLTQHLFRKINKRPGFRSQKLENVSQALNYIERDEGIRLVNIDSSDIVDGKPKLILGLVWMLILHYSVSAGVWEGEEEPSSLTKTRTAASGTGAQAAGKAGAAKGGAGAPASGDSAAAQLKHRLLGWINQKLPDHPVKNLTSDWRDGKAIGALVDAVAPGLCPDWGDWDPKNNFKNAKEAMDAAENWLSVPQLIKPEEMIDPHVDEKAMITYLSQYPQCHLKPDAPLRPRANAARVRAYGPGLEASGNTVGTPARFTVETYSAGKGQLTVVVLNPHGIREEAQVTFNDDREQTYTCVYTPSMEGLHKVIVQFAGKDIPGSPYQVKVQDQPGDPSKVTVSGPGVQPRGVMVGERTYFEVNTKGAGKGIVDVQIVAPSSVSETQASIKPKLSKRPGSEDIVLVEYTARIEGPHQVNVSFAGSAVPKSPFEVTVHAPFDPHKVVVTGRGIQPRGIRVKDLCDFVVHTEGAGDAECQIKVFGPNNTEEPVKIRQSDRNYSCSYIPSGVGTYTVKVSYGGKEVRRSPFLVPVKAAPTPGEKDNLAKICAFGPGLFGGYVNYPCMFTLDTGGQKAQISFNIEGPAEAKIAVEDKHDGTANLTYTPTAPGEYSIHILANEEDIPNSPFMATIVWPPNGHRLDFDPNKVLCKGAGLDNAALNQEASFSVDIRPALSRSRGSMLAVEPISPGSQSPAKPQYFTFGAVPGLVGLGVVGGGLSGAGNSTPTHRRVSLLGARPNSLIESAATQGLPQLIVQVIDMGTGLPLDVTSTSPETGLSEYKYTPRTTNKHLIYVVLGGINVSSSPYRVKITEPPRADKIKVSGEGIHIAKRNQPTEFTIDMSDAGGAELSVGVMDERGRVIKFETSQKPAPNGKGSLVTVSYTPHSIGTYNAEVSFGGKQVSGSPFPIQVLPDVEITKVAVDGLEDSYFVQSMCEFTVDARPIDDKGKAPVKVVFQPPSGKLYVGSIDNKHDGTYYCSFPITEKGSYKLQVYYDEMELTHAGSPYNFITKTGFDTSKVRVSGAPLQGGFTNEKQVLTIDTKQAGEGMIGFMMDGPVEAKLDFRDLKNGMCECSFVPTKSGIYKLTINYAGKEIPTSPYNIKIKDHVNSSRVKVHGPGIDPKSVLRAGKPAKFEVDASAAGDAQLEVTYAPLTGLAATRGSAIDQQADVRSHGDGHYDVVYYPEKEGTYQVSVTYGGQPVSGSPFKHAIAPAFDEKLVHISGDAARLGSPTGPGLPASVPTSLVLDTREAGEAPLEVSITDPSGNAIPVRITANPDGTNTVSFTPDDAGLYKANITYGKRPIADSPLTLKVVPTGNASQCKVVGGKRNAVPVDQETHFVVRTPIDFLGPSLKAGVLTPSVGQCPRVTARIVQPDGTLLPVISQPERSLAPGSRASLYSRPISEELSSRDGVVVKQLGATDVLSLFTEGIDTEPDAAYSSVAYTPHMLGEHRIELKYGGQDIPDGKFVQKVVSIEEFHEIQETERVEAMTQTSKSKIQALRPRDLCTLPPSFFVPIDFKLPGEILNGRTVSASVLKPTGKSDPTTFVQNPDASGSILYQPTEKGWHEIRPMFEGLPGAQYEDLPEAPYKFYADTVESGTVTAYGLGLHYGQVGEPAKFTLVTLNKKLAEEGGVAILVDGPSKADLNIEDNKEQRGTSTCSYVPHVPGDYKISIKAGGQEIQGSPFHAKVIGSARLRGKEMQLAPTSATEFRLMPVPRAADGSQIDPSQLVASIRLPSGIEEPCALAILPGNYLGVSFTPKEVGEHLVQVLHKGKHIVGSPTKIMITENEIGNPAKVKCSGKGLECGITEKENTFLIDPTEAGYGGLSLSIEGPSKVEVECKDLPDGKCEVVYVPHQPGEYLVNIKYADGHVKGSPFHVDVTSGDATDATRGKHTTASSKQLKTSGSFAGIGTSCELNVAIPVGHSVSELSGFVKSPSGRISKCNLVEVDSRTIAVQFVPTEEGVHEVDVRLNGVSIPGSPFQFTVGTPTSGGPEKVKAFGPGLTNSVVGIPAEFMVNTHEAGPGSLAIGIEGPSKAEITFEDGKDSSTNFVSYTVSVPGDYAIAVRYNEQHIPGSPFPMKASLEGDVLVTRRSQLFTNAARASSYRPESFRPAHANASFTFPFENAGTDSPMALRAIVEDPNGREDEAEVSQIDSNQYAVRFTPRVPGAHMVSVLTGNRHVPGSPFKILVSDLLTTPDPSFVHATGEGLTHGNVGQKSKFVVNTVGANAGQLSVTIKGPSRVQLTCSEVDEGYEYTYVPYAPGEYNISIRFGGNFHIVGSPFTAFIAGRPISDVQPGESTTVVDAREKPITASQAANVSDVLTQLGASDANLVQVSGTGLKRAVACRPAHFSVDTSALTGMGAGARSIEGEEIANSALLIGMCGVGKTTRPVDEMRVKYAGRDQYTVEYNVRETGKYALIVMWGLKHVPGSPFMVDVV